MPVRREIEVEATPEEVWEALATEEGRERWLDEPQREIHVESESPPHRLVWWWWQEDEEPSRVELLVVPVPAGARVVVIETAPQLPLAQMASSLALVAA